MIFREDCLDTFLSSEFRDRALSAKFDDSDKECLKFSVSKLLGTAIIVGSGILKVPQIIKIM